jgi:hypothetical protein
VIGKVAPRGTDTAGLLRYLFGPGKVNEHTDPHVVAGFDEPEALEPVLAGSGRREIRTLAGLLDQPVAAASRPPAKPVYHLVLRNAPEDRRLTDAEWRTVCEDVMSRTGIAPAGDPHGCRWVAVRHAEDHVHLVATLVRQDGRPCWPRNDFHRIGEACRDAEDRLQLRATAPRDRTSTPPPTRAETEKAARQGRPETGRVRLRREVRVAAAASTGVDDFLARLRGAGIVVHERHSVQDPAEITGYAVALPDDLTATGSPVFYAGGRLAADLTLPKLTSSWATTPGARPSVAAPGRSTLIAAERRAMWEHAREVVDTVAARIAADPSLLESAGTAAAARDLLAGTARALEGSGVPGPLTHAADVFDRATREPYARAPVRTGEGLWLRHAARLVAVSGRHHPTASTTALVSSLLVLANGVAQLRAAQHRTAQAAAADAAAAELRAAIATTAHSSLSGGRTRPLLPTGPVAAVVPRREGDVRARRR